MSRTITDRAMWMLGMSSSSCLAPHTAVGCLNDQTFQSEVCRLPFEYGIALSMQLIRGVLTRQHVRYNAAESEPHSVFYWLLPA